MKFKVGYAESPFGLCTQKYRIIDELKGGGFLVTRPPMIMTRPWNGSHYISEGSALLIIKELSNIHEEEIIIREAQNGCI